MNRAGDDPAGLAKASTLKAEIASFGQVKKNINSALSELGGVTSGISTILDYLTEMRTLAVAASGESSEAVRASYASQFTELIAGIDEVTKAVKFNGVAAIGLGAGATAVQVGINATDVKSLTFSAASASALAIPSTTSLSATD